jgi:diguanylate cyclase (GGDEF)-like protein
MIPSGERPVDSDAKARPPRRKLVLRRWMPYALLLAGCGLAMVASWYVSSTRDALARVEFLRDASTLRRQIEVAVNTHFDVVRAGAALIGASNEINAREFRNVVTGFALEERYPGLHAIGFAQRVRQPNLRAFVRAAELDGVAPLQVRPDQPRAEFYPIVLIEPQTDLNRAAVGFDIATNNMLREAMDLAADSGEAAASTRLVHLDPSDARSAQTFLFLTPIYRRGLPADTVEDRRRALVGFVFGLISPRDLLQRLDPNLSGVAFRVFDDAQPRAASLLHESPRVEGAPYRSAEPLQVGGRPWLLEMSGGSPELLPAPVARETLFSGLVLAVLLFILTRAQVRGWETATRHQAELQALAQRDSLTRLPNRALLDEHLSKAIALARRRDERVAVLFLDIDHFKRINDSLGHSVGDQVLQAVAVRLLACVRTSDTVSRLGGDEFVLLLSGIERAEDVEARARAIIEALAAPHKLDRHEIYCTASIGISMFPDDGSDAAALVRAADVAMYEAKQRGRNQCRFYDVSKARETERV